MDKPGSSDHTDDGTPPLASASDSESSNSDQQNLPVDPPVERSQRHRHQPDAIAVDPPVERSQRHSYQSDSTVHSSVPSLEGVNNNDRLFEPRLIPMESNSGYHCKYLGCTFTSHETEAFLLHEDSHVSSEITECAGCFLQFPSYAAMRRHYLSVHQGIRTLECNVCSARFLRREQFNNHVSQHTPSNNNLRGPLMISCRICNKAFKEPKSLIEHCHNDHGPSVRSEPSPINLVQRSPENASLDKPTAGKSRIVHLIHPVKREISNGGQDNSMNNVEPNEGSSSSRPYAASVGSSSSRPCAASGRQLFSNLRMRPYPLKRELINDGANQNTSSGIDNDEPQVGSSSNAQVNPEPSNSQSSREGTCPRFLDLLCCPYWSSRLCTNLSKRSILRDRHVPYSSCSPYCGNRSRAAATSSSSPTVGTSSPSVVEGMPSTSQLNRIIALGPDKSLCCIYCDITFPDQTLYLLHRSLHTDSNPWKCNLCGKVCKGKYDFNAHVISKSHK